jgi:nicotinate-nucleotide adenylyltransferase
MRKEDSLLRFAVLGGSFNPVHIGHLFLADSVLSELAYDRVIFIPAFQSPFKIGAETASPDDRISMLAAAISGDPRLTIDDCEIRREGVSFTVDTLADIIARYRPEGKPGLILGDDLVSTFDKWRKPEEIAEMADIIIAGRQTNTSAPNFPFPCKVLGNEIMDVSSSQIREKIGTGKAWHYLVPPGARLIIEAKGLYGLSGASDISGQRDEDQGFTDIIMRIESDIRGILNCSRFIHSRNTALLSRDLCLRFGLDPRKGYLAGIAHDMCKSMEDDELIRLARADGGSISKLEKKKPGLLHARAAAVLARKRYGIGDRDVLEAIQHHTTGSKNMGSLAKVLYVADKIEVSRINVDPALREMGEGIDLDTIFLAVLNNTVAFLKSRKKDISYGTKMLLAAIETRNKDEKGHS